MFIKILNRTMNIYHALNKITAEIEQNLDDDIDYDKLATYMHTNADVTRRLFALIAGLGLSEYIRKRRLSRAASDLITSHPKLIDLAIKYGYDNPQSFSRAFTAFHSIKPSDVTENTLLKDFPRLVFDEVAANNPSFTYEVINHPAFTLYGGHVTTDNNNISHDAPRFFKEYQSQHLADYGYADFGMITYDQDHEHCNAYYVLYESPIPDAERVELPAHRWLKFIAKSSQASDIQILSHDFYESFLPSSSYAIDDFPELEYYHDNITEFWVPIK